jgi:hypothetical protein
MSSNKHKHKHKFLLTILWKMVKVQCKELKEDLESGKQKRVQQFFKPSSQAAGTSQRADEGERSFKVTGSAD